MGYLAAWMLLLSGFFVDAPHGVRGDVRHELLLPSGLGLPETTNWRDSDGRRLRVTRHGCGRLDRFELRFVDGLAVGRSVFLRDARPWSEIPRLDVPDPPWRPPEIFGGRIGPLRWSCADATLSEPVRTSRVGDRRRTHYAGRLSDGGGIHVWIDTFGDGDARLHLAIVGPVRRGGFPVLHFGPDGWDPPEADDPGWSLIWRREPRDADAREAFRNDLLGGSILHAGGLGWHAFGIEGPRRIRAHGSGIAVSTGSEDEELATGVWRVLAADRRRDGGSALDVVVLPRLRPANLASSSPSECVRIAEIMELDRAFTASRSAGFLFSDAELGEHRFSRTDYAHQEWDVPLGLALDAIASGDPALFRRARIVAVRQWCSGIDPATGLNFKHGPFLHGGDVEVGHHVVSGAVLVGALGDDPWIDRRARNSAASARPHLRRVPDVARHARDVAWALRAASEDVLRGDDGAEATLRRLLAHLRSRQTRSGAVLLEGGPTRGTGWVAPWHDFALLVPSWRAAARIAADGASIEAAERHLRFLVRNTEKDGTVTGTLLVDAEGDVLGRGKNAPSSDEAYAAIDGMRACGLSPSRAWMKLSADDPTAAVFTGGRIARRRLGAAIAFGLRYFAQ